MKYVIKEINANFVKELSLIKICFCQVYVFINKTGVYDELTDFCDEKFIIRVPNVLRQFLGIKSCPIEKVKFLLS